LLRIVCACAGAVRHKLESGRLTFDRSGEKNAGAGSNVEPRVVLRRFACPRYGHLLDTEAALPEDPFLEDVVTA
jgi:hypothetical protein